LSREIGSNFDDVKKVADSLTIIEKVGGSELVTLSKVELETLAALTGVDIVAGVAPYIQAVAESDLVTLTAAQWQEILTITGAAELIRDLTVEVESLSSEQAATVELNGSVLKFGIPRGVDGYNGTIGLTPIITMSVDEDMNLVYDVEYVESTTEIVMEW
jgi:hypothetical protein